MRACSRRVFPQNTGPMRKTPDAQPDAQRLCNSIELALPVSLAVLLCNVDA